MRTMKIFKLSLRPKMPKARLAKQHSLASNHSHLIRYNTAAKAGHGPTEASADVAAAASCPAGTGRRRDGVLVSICAARRHTGGG